MPVFIKMCLLMYQISSQLFSMANSEILMYDSVFSLFLMAPLIELVVFGFILAVRK